MKQKLWLTLITYLAYCIDKKLYEAIDYLREQVRVLIEHQEKQNERILARLPAFNGRCKSSFELSESFAGPSRWSRQR